MINIHRCWMWLSRSILGCMIPICPFGREKKFSNRTIIGRCYRAIGVEVHRVPSLLSYIGKQGVALCEKVASPTLPSLLFSTRLSLTDLFPSAPACLLSRPACSVFSPTAEPGVCLRFCTFFTFLFVTPWSTDPSCGRSFFYIYIPWSVITPRKSQDSWGLTC